VTDGLPRPAAGATAGFAPLPWLRSAHLQSVLPSLPLRRPFVRHRARPLLAASQPVVLDCGEGVRLLAHHASRERDGAGPARRVVVMIHGWEGSADSLYLLSLGQQLFVSGADVYRLNLRDHGASHHLNPELFHSCRIREVVGAVQGVQRRHPDARLSLAGFSLGGNFVLRVAARAREAGLELEQAVAICPVLDPRRTLAALETGWALYRRYFVLKWRRSLRLKQQAWPGRFDFEDVLQLDSLSEMTDRLVCRYGGFRSLEEYLAGYAIVGAALGPLAVPSRIIAAADDPIIPAEDLGRLARPSRLEISCSAFGGHCGFFDGRAPSWLEREVLRTILGRD